MKRWKGQENAREKSTLGDFNTKFQTSDWKDQILVLPRPPLALLCGIWTYLPFAIPHLLEGSQVPNADSVVKGHSGHLSPVLFCRKRQHWGHVGACQHSILAGGDIKEAQVS